MEWRVKRLTELEFRVGLWHRPNYDLGMGERSGATLSIMNGYRHGRLADDEGAEELLKTARRCAKCVTVEQFLGDCESARRDGI